MARVCNCTAGCNVCGRCCQDCTCGTTAIRPVHIPGVDLPGRPISTPRRTELVDCAACEGTGRKSYRDGSYEVCKGCNGAGKQRV